MNSRSTLSSPETIGAGGESPLPSGLARRIRMVLFDVDGVFTDAGISVGELPGGERIELKHFDIRDGLGVRLLLEAGIEVAVISGRTSAATSLRMAELGVREVHQDGSAAKLPIAEALRVAKGLEWEEIAMMGDDLPDLPVLRRCGLSAAPNDAVRDVAGMVRLRTAARGGEGAVREFIEVLLRARGDWDGVVERYLAARGETG